MEKGKIVRSRVDEVRLTGRNTQGVQFANAGQGDAIVARGPERRASGRGGAGDRRRRRRGRCLRRWRGFVGCGRGCRTVWWTNEPTMTTEASSELDRTGRYAWDCRGWVDRLVQYADTIRYAGRRASVAPSSAAPQERTDGAHSDRRPRSGAPMVRTVTAGCSGHCHRPTGRAWLRAEPARPAPRRRRAAAGRRAATATRPQSRPRPRAGCRGVAPGPAASRRQGRPASGAAPGDRPSGAARGRARRPVVGDEDVVPALGRPGHRRRRAHGGAVD